MDWKRDASRWTALAVALAASLSTAPALAQNEGEEWLLTIGGGAQVFPDYPGADDLGVFPLPIVGLRRAGEPLAVKAPDDGLAIGVVRFLGDDKVFDFGPVLTFQNKRDPDDVGAAVPRVGTTVEAGGFAQLYVTPELRIRAEGRFGLGGHDGFVGSVGADYVYRTQDAVVTIGPRARFSDNAYQDAYFSVSGPVATATGLSAFDADGGLHALGATVGATWLFDREWGLYGYAGYDRLVGDAQNSPIVRKFGDADQFSAGIGITYSFGIGRF